MWEINNSLQTLTFLRSFIFGMIIKFVYDILRSVSVSFKFSKVSVLVCDVIFMISLIPIVFCFLLVTTNGFIRAYVITGIIIGIVIFSLTLTRIFKPILNKILSYIYKAFTFVCRKNEAFLNLTFDYFNRISKKARFLCEKMQKYLKKLLKKR